MILERQVEATAIDGLQIIRSKAVADDRGTVREFFRASEFTAEGLPTDWGQINLTATSRGGLRGLHAEAMTKLVGVAHGTAFAAYADARHDSPSYGKVVTLELSLGTQVLVPKGVCNGFQAISAEDCLYLYCFDAEWSAGMAGVAVNPLDPELAIAWPIQESESIISAKDRSAPLFSEV